MYIIDIGTNYGADLKYYPKGLDIHCFEPNPILCEYIKANHSNRKIHVHNVAVSDYVGRSIFYLTEDTYSSSLYTLTEDYKDDFVLKQIQEIMVDVIKIGDFIMDNNIQQIDYYKSDAQGMDYRILKSMGDQIRKIRAGRIEVVNKNNIIYKHQDNLLDDVVDYLKYYEFELTNEQTLRTLFDTDNIVDYDLKFRTKRNFI